MKNLKLALVQHQSLDHQTHAHIAQNTAQAISFIEEASAHGADFVLFPECYLTSYTPPEICRHKRPLADIQQDPTFRRWCDEALDDDSPYLQQLCETARKHAIGVGITSFTKGNETLRNSLFIIDRSGDICMKYNKVHTCDFDWECYLESGDAFHVCQFDGLCIGAMICYDREHPESGRELMLQGAELVLVPNDCGSMAPRLQELSVSAMQNMSGIAMANPPGRNKGNSCAYHPIVWNIAGIPVDNTIVVADSEFEGLVYAEFNIQALRAYRKREVLGKNRKPKTYSHIGL